MRFIKTVDEKFKEIGFVKTRDDEYIVDYEKEVKAFGYIHQISLCHKASGRHIIQSYEKDSQPSDIYSNIVGMSPYEAKLCIKKMKQKGWA